MSQKEYEHISTKRLRRLVKRTSKTLSEMQEELDRRYLEEQHSEIDHLEEHLDETEHGLANFFAFFKEVMGDKK